MKNLVKQPVHTQYDREAQDFEEVVPRSKARSLLDKEIDRLAHERFEKNQKPKR